MRHHRPKSRRQQGIALITALMLVSVVSVLLGGISLLSMTNFRMTNSYRLRSSAALAAQAGMDVAEAFVSELFHAGVGDNTLSGIPGLGVASDADCGGPDTLSQHTGATTCVRARYLPPYTPPASSFWNPLTADQLGRPNLFNTLDNPEAVFRYLDSYFDLPRIGQVNLTNESYQRFIVWPSQPVGSNLRYRTMIVLTRYARQPTLAEQYSRSVTIKVVGAAVRDGTNTDDTSDPPTGSSAAPRVAVKMDCANMAPQIVLTQTILLQVKRKRGYAAPNMRLHPDYMAAEVIYHPRHQEVRPDSPDPNVFWYNTSVDPNSSLPINPNPYTHQGLQAAATLVNSTSDFFLIDYAFKNLLDRDPTDDEIRTWMPRLNYRVGDILNVPAQTPPPDPTSTTVTSADKPNKATVASTAGFADFNYVRITVGGTGPEAGVYYATLTKVDADQLTLEWAPRLEYPDPDDPTVPPKRLPFDPPAGTVIQLMPVNAYEFPPAPTAPEPLAIRRPDTETQPTAVFPEPEDFSDVSYAAVSQQQPAVMPTPIIPPGAPIPSPYPQLKTEQTAVLRPELGYDPSRDANFQPPLPVIRGGWPARAAPPDLTEAPNWEFFWPLGIAPPCDPAVCTGSNSLVLSVLPGGLYPPFIVRRDSINKDRYQGLYLATNPYHRANDLLYTLTHAYPGGGGLPGEGLDCGSSQPPDDTVLHYLWQVQCGRVRVIDPVDSLADQSIIVLQDEARYQLHPSTTQVAVPGNEVRPLNNNKLPYLSARFPPSMADVLPNSTTRCAAGGGSGCTHELLAPPGVGILDPALLIADDWVWENLEGDHYQPIGGGAVCCGGRIPCSQANAG